MTAAAPVALFIYNRPNHLRRTLACLARCEGIDGRPIHVFCDGARSEAHRDSVMAARQAARDAFVEAAIFHEAPINKGLARSVIDGVDALTREHGRVIVVEDDLELAPGFLRFMDLALDHYSDEPNVMQVSGHIFDVPEFSNRKSAVILPLTTTWGWATWRRAWERFDEATTVARRVLDSVSERKAFNLNGTYDYAKMLEDQLVGQRDSWGIRFYLATFDANGVGVFPPRTLVRNTGLDGSGSHGRGWLRGYSGTMKQEPCANVSEWTFPPTDYSPDDCAAVKRAIFRQNGGRIGQIADLVKRTLRGIR